MVGKLDEALRFHETALSLRAQRQQLLASNIANADTPNYKARDIDFGGALKDALARSSPASAPTASPLMRTAATHLNGVAADKITGGATAQFRTAAQGSVDGNTVDMDAERNQFVDNAVRYEAGLTLISGQIKNLLAAIQSQ
ncbi:flagellar basal body rod protein FlgB [Noviherbaspirillum galbum]|uniref:Flagellar basal body rod protein FlgB n=1 Tax=Noviherbaspirillum galbum TaxID=2709383 RepID=A0A6B3STK0_9BURK|nr:flagellar basal body rod protein FlgB [Noviherbaspirillum galbum]NEX62675.1 flagellar basal body rod protein FlgB [Noviherbaspirillum galbum]